MRTSYSDKMKTHLGAYKTTKLGITASGKWRGRGYSHILPQSQRMLNILEPIRGDFDEYLSMHPKLKLHKDFAHLNSSQAACVNFFLPLLSGMAGATGIDQGLLPFDPATIETFEFEYVPDSIEGTNFDFWARTEDSKEIFCEFKLTENEFGRAKKDERHQKKLTDIYSPMLAGKIQPEMLEPARFFEHYQLLRNIAYADPDGSASVMFLLPKANDRLIQPLADMSDWLSPTIKAHVSVLYLEDLVSRFRQCLEANLATYFDAYAEKYLPT